MTVEVLSFAILKERLGRQRESVELPEGAAVSDLLVLLQGREAQHAGLWKSIAVAVNQVYARPHTPLADGDEVALLPRSVVAPVRVEILDTVLPTAEVLDQIKAGSDGAVCLFDGIVRNNTRGRHHPLPRLRGLPRDGPHPDGVSLQRGPAAVSHPRRSPAPPPRPPPSRRNQRPHRRRLRPSRRRVRRLPLAHRHPQAAGPIWKKETSPTAQSGPTANPSPLQSPWGERQRQRRPDRGRQPLCGVEESRTASWQTVCTYDAKPSTPRPDPRPASGRFCRCFSRRATFAFSPRHTVCCDSSPIPPPSRTACRCPALPRPGAYRAPHAARSGRNPQARIPPRHSGSQCR